MSTLEYAYLADQTIQNLEGLRRDLRANASEYVTTVTNGSTLSSVVDIAHRDAAAYLARLAWVSSVYNDTDGRTALVAGLTARGVTEDDLVAACAELTTGAQAQADASPTTADELVALRDALLACVPAHRLLW